MAYPKTDPLIRFEKFIAVEPNTGCWLWTGGLDHNGYGRFWNGTKQVFAHQWSYRHFRGDIPEGLEPDHTCRVRSCANPYHLEPVTHKVNLLRGATVNARSAAVTACPQGHDYDAENTHIKRNGKRQCRACDRERHRITA